MHAFTSTSDSSKFILGMRTFDAFSLAIKVLEKTLIFIGLLTKNIRIDSFSYFFNLSNIHQYIINSIFLLNGSYQHDSDSVFWLCS